MQVLGFNFIKLTAEFGSINFYGHAKLCSMFNECEVLCKEEEKGGRRRRKQSKEVNMEGEREEAREGKSKICDS